MVYGFASLTDATPGSSGEGHERVVVAIGRPLRQEVVRVEFGRIGVHVRATVQLVRCNNDSGTRRHFLTVGSYRTESFKKLPYIMSIFQRLRQWNKLLTKSDILFKMTSNDWHWWEHPKCFHETPFQVFHFQGILECGGTVWITEDFIELINNLVLNVLMDSHHG